MDRHRTHPATDRPSLLQMSAAQRLGLALIACAVVWAAIGLALI
jgi:hypothetical protein